MKKIKITNNLIWINYCWGFNLSLPDNYMILHLSCNVILLTIPLVIKCPWKYNFYWLRNIPSHVNALDSFEHKLQDHNSKLCYNFKFFFPLFTLNWYLSINNALVILLQVLYFKDCLKLPIAYAFLLSIAIIGCPFLSLQREKNVSFSFLLFLK